MSRKRPASANRFRDARRAAAKKARLQPSGQLTFPGWFDTPAGTLPGTRPPVAGVRNEKRQP
jgi:hypothetical protein